MSNSKANRPHWFECSKLERMLVIASYILSSPFRRKWPYSPSSVKVYLLVRDVYSPLVDIITNLLEQGVLRSNILILDNGSTSLSCFEAFKSLANQGIKCLRVPDDYERYGPYAFWIKNSLHQIDFPEYPFIVTDVDLAFPREVPSDWLAQMFRYLSAYPQVPKVSLSLSLSNLSVPTASSIIRHEVKLFTRPLYRLLSFLFIRSDLPGSFVTTDTTFSLYRPRQPFSTFSIRLPYPYTLRHLPWYSGFIHSKEYEYYMLNKLSSFGHWSQ